MTGIQNRMSELGEEFDNVEVHHLRESIQEAEVTVHMNNPDRGLPAPLQRFFDQRELSIVDFSHVTEDNILLYLVAE